MTCVGGHRRKVKQARRNRENGQAVLNLRQEPMPMLKTAELKELVWSRYGGFAETGGNQESC